MFDLVVETIGEKAKKASAKMTKDREVQRAFHDIQAEDWKHIRTSHPTASNVNLPLTTPPLT